MKKELWINQEKTMTNGELIIVLISLFSAVCLGIGIGYFIFNGC